MQSTQLREIHNRRLRQHAYRRPAIVQIDPGDIYFARNHTRQRRIRADRVNRGRTHLRRRR